MKYVVDKEIEELRLNLCNSCNHNRLGICTQCNCLIITTVKLRSSKCPLDKWSSTI